jgi:hypothetical protein
MQIGNHNSSLQRAQRQVWRACERYFDLGGRPSGGPSEASSPPSFLDYTILQHTTSSDLFGGYLSERTPTMELTADNCALPSVEGVAATVSLLDNLPPQLARLYSGPEELILPEEERVRAPYVLCVRSRADYVALVRKLFRLGMMDFRESVLAVNGLFGVPKTEHVLRLIIDARPANACFKTPLKVELPSPDVMAQLCAGEGPLFFAKCDMKDFYHFIKIPDWMVPYFGLPAVTPRELGFSVPGFAADASVFPCLLSLGMGFSHAVLLAQSVHRHVVLSSPFIREEDEITASGDRRLDRARWGAYIDDGFDFGHVRSDVDRLVKAHMAAMVAAGFKVNDAKTVYATSDPSPCLGHLVDGRSSTIGVDPGALTALVQDTLALVDRGLATGKELEKLLGRWTWAILVRRPAFAVFSSVYRFAERARSRRWSLWPSVVRELRSIAGLAPLLFVKLSSPWAPRAWAYDSCLSGFGVSSIPCTPAVAMQVAAFWKRFPSYGGAFDVVKSFFGDRPWSSVMALPWKWPAHINVLEMQALAVTVRRVTSSPDAAGCRVLFLGDNTSVVAAFAKGRCSSFALLSKLRQLSAVVLAHGIFPVSVWVPSESQPADEGSRLFEH